jgi:hypothetical protein
VLDEQSQLIRGYVTVSVDCNRPKEGEAKELCQPSFGAVFHRQSPKVASARFASVSVVVRIPFDSHHILLTILPLPFLLFFRRPSPTFTDLHRSP